MGFQFNHVGGGTKTRRPITLHMQYNAGCVQPQCFLVTEDFGDQEVTLDGVLVFAQAMSKTLLLAVEDLGADGLGRIRSSYCEAAMQNIAQDVSRGLQMLRQGGELN